MIYTRAGIPGTRAGTPDCRGASSESLRLVKPKLPKMHSGEFSRKIQKKRPRAEKLPEHKKTEITALGRCRYDILRRPVWDRKTPRYLRWFSFSSCLFLFAFLVSETNPNRLTEPNHPRRWTRIHRLEDEKTIDFPLCSSESRHHRDVQAPDKANLP